MTKLSSYINVLHPNKLDVFLKDEQKVDLKFLALNIFLTLVFTLFSQLYSAATSTQAKFSLFSVIWSAIGFFLFCYVLNFIAIRFGSKENLIRLCYLLSILGVATNLLVAPFYLVIPRADSKFLILGCVLFIPLLLIVLYSLYRNYQIFCSLYPEIKGRDRYIVYGLSLGILFFISLGTLLFFPGLLIF